MLAGEQTRGRYVRLADRAARFYAPAVHVLGLATLVGWLAVGTAIGGVATGGFLPLWGALIADCFGREAFGRVMGLMGPLMLPLNVTALQLAPWSYDATGSYELAWLLFLGWLALAACALGLVRLRVKRASAEMEDIFDDMSQKEGAGPGGRVQTSPFAEITDEDIDSLFSE